MRLVQLASFCGSLRPMASTPLNEAGMRCDVYGCVECALCESYELSHAGQNSFFASLRNYRLYVAVIDSSVRPEVPARSADTLPLVWLRQHLKNYQLFVQGRAFPPVPTEEPCRRAQMLWPRRLAKTSFGGSCHGTSFSF